MINIRELATNPSLLNEETLPELKDLLEKYPFFQLVRLLYVANLYKLHAQNFGVELRKASVFVPDRNALFALTESSIYQLPTQESDISIETEGDENRTLSLINDFLTGKNLKDSGEHDALRLIPSVADLTNDYASFLLQQEEWDGDNTVDDTIPQLKGAALIDNFIEETGTDPIKIKRMNEYGSRNDQAGEFRIRCQRVMEDRKHCFPFFFQPGREDICFFLLLIRKMNLMFFLLFCLWLCISRMCTAFCFSFFLFFSRLFLSSFFFIACA